MAEPRPSASGLSDASIPNRNSHDLDSETDLAHKSSCETRNSENLNRENYDKNLLKINEGALASVSLKGKGKSLKRKNENIHSGEKV